MICFLKRANIKAICEGTPPLRRAASLTLRYIHPHVPCDVSVQHSPCGGERENTCHSQPSQTAPATASRLVAGTPQVRYGQCYDPRRTTLVVVGHDI